MTNERKAVMLECIALGCLEGVAALLRECAAMMRERWTVEWDTEGGATKNGLYLWAGAVCNGFAWMVLKGTRRLYMDWHPNLEAAQAAAVAWVDEQEGRDA